MNVGLDGRTAEGGQMPPGHKYLLVSDDPDLGVVHVHPIGDLAVRHHKDLPDPGSELLDGADRVPEIGMKMT